jgi:hypothetical protein
MTMLARSRPLSRARFLSYASHEAWHTGYVCPSNRGTEASILNNSCRGPAPTALPDCADGGIVADLLAIRYAALQMVVDLNRLSALLREHLSLEQEKVVRLYFGLGCSQSFSTSEIAREFRVSWQRISGIVRAAQRKLTLVGLTPGVLREAASLHGGTWRQPEPQRAAEPPAVVRRRLCRGRSIRVGR